MLRNSGRLLRSRTCLMLRPKDSGRPRLLKTFPLKRDNPYRSLLEAILSSPSSFAARGGSPETGCWPASSANRETWSTRKSSFATTWCCGTQAISTTCDWSWKTPSRARLSASSRSSAGVIRSIKYEGVKSASVSDILERFKERRVGLSVESRYDPTRVQRAVIVLQELLGERGRQYADIQPQVSQIPPSSVEVIFNVTEGPKVKVGKIFVEDNEVMSNKRVRKAMKNLYPMGLPRSIIFERLFRKTFDIRKLEEDKERVRNMYQERGHFKATVTRHELEMRDQKGRKLFPFPLIFKKKGKRADVTVHMDEGAEYRLGKLSFTDVELFRDPTVLENVFKMDANDIFDIKKLREGLDNLKKLYGEFGYIDFVAEPNFEFRDDESPPKVDLNLAVDEGKQFFVRRINFSGNTSTRDKVIRRELLLDEGDMFNTRVWDLSILRLNQLGYFEPLKEEEATDIRRDTRQGLVDLTLNVKERGKNTVSLNGGVSGFAGSFIGFGYATNNFLGLGETLSFDAQLGSRQRALTFGFTEPYLFNRPIQAGFTVFTSRFNFNQGREASIFSGANLIPLFNQLGRDNYLDFRQNTTGFTTFVSYPLKNFNRLSLTYRLQRDDLTTFSKAADNLFRFQNFLGVSGPNSLEGITTSEIVPGFFHNTVNHPITPSGGKSLVRQYRYRRLRRQYQLPGADGRGEVLQVGRHQRPRDWHADAALVSHRVWRQGASAVPAFLHGG